MRFRLVVTFAVLLGAFVQAQTKVPAQLTPQPPPEKDDLTSAREATDSYLNGVKLAELPEGRQLLSETQWITFPADNGENFYHRPRFTEATSLFEKLFDTDVHGVQGYKRLLDMKAVSKAGTPLLTHYFMVAFKDRHTNKWKVLETGTDEDADVDRQVAYFSQRLHQTDFTSEQDNYLTYGQWLLLAGRIKDAREALTTGLSASPNITDPAYPRTDKYAPLHRLQILTLLGVIDAITGKAEDIETGETLLAEATQLAEVGRSESTQEEAQSMQNGQESITAVVTSPAGAEIYIDENKATGVTPLVFVLIKRAAPRTITIKLTGYKTVEKTFVPDGKPIPIAATLEKEAK